MKNILTIVMMAALLSMSSLALREMDCNVDDCTGLVGYWKMNQDPMYHNTIIADDHTNGLSLRLQTNNGVTNKSVEGRLNNAVSLDGADDNMFSLSQYPALNIYGDITIEAWIKTTDDYGFIVQRVRQFNPYQGYAFKIDNGRLGFFTTGSWWVYSSGTVNDGQWHHVAVTGSGSTGTFYIDGVPSGTFGYSPSANYQSITLYLGSERGTGGSSSFLDGTLDDVKIWDKALSESEIGDIASYGYIGGGAEGDPELPEFSTVGLTLIAIIFTLMMVTRKK